MAIAPAIPRQAAKWRNGKYKLARSFARMNSITPTFTTSSKSKVMGNPPAK
jgi:hypothetical protein